MSSLVWIRCPVWSGKRILGILSEGIHLKTLLGFVLMTCSVIASAQVNIAEKVLTVPVTVQNTYGKDVTHNVVVTIFRDERRNQAPFLVLHHGRAGSSADRAKLGRARYQAISTYFVEQGFVVIVPTRGGYGETGGEDTEDAGPCSNKNYGSTFKAAADTTVTVLKSLKDKPYIDWSKGIMVGQSYGGATSVALSAYDIPGMRAAFNFAGGGGGDPKKNPEYPCRPDLLQRQFAEYGAKSRVPVYWFYSVNDKYWGEKLPKEWFDAFIKAGGKGDFYSLPAYKNDGHPTFSANSGAWKAAFESILKDLGMSNR